MSTQKNEHNPSRFTPDKVGESFRLLRSDERVQPGDEWWVNENTGWLEVGGRNMGVEASECLTVAIRRRITPPTDTTGSGREGETPETDLAIYQKSQHGQTVMADFGRKLERRLNEEKRRRINYQTIVYDVCNLLDKANGKKPGNGIVCGTGDSPTKQTQEAVTRLIAERDAAMNDLQYRDESIEVNRKYVEKCNHLPSLVIQSENGPICCECARVAALAQVEALRRDGERLQWILDLIAEHGTDALQSFPWSILNDPANDPDEDDPARLTPILDRAAIDSAQRQEGR